MSHLVLVVVVALLCSCCALPRFESVVKERLRETTNLALWPQPSFSQISNDRVNLTARASFNIRIVAFNDTEGILYRAAQRYYNYIYQWRTGQFEQPSTFESETAEGAAMLSVLSVNVTGHSTVLDGSMDESYTITVVNSGAPTATLTAPSIWGAIRGLETFSQLVQYDFVGQTYFMFALTVRDKPRIGFRAVMLDPARHYLTMESILQFVDAMAMAKLNVLHMHFIDSESWPVEIKAYPLLAVNGAFARIRHSYPQSSLKMLVAYARDRGIRVIPGMDFPSHTCVCKVYPELCVVVQTPDGKWIRGGFDPTSDEAWKFYTTMWTELGTIFTDTDVHLGADEVNPDMWANSPNITAFRNKYAAHCPDDPKFTCASLQDVASYFFRRAAGIVHALGKNAHGWWPGLANKAWGGTSFPDYVILNMWLGYAPWPQSFKAWQPAMTDLISLPAKTYISGPFYVVAPETQVVSYNPTKKEDKWADWMLMYKTDPLNFTAPADDVTKYFLGAETAFWGDASHVDSGSLVASGASILIGVGENWWSVSAHPPPPKPWKKLADGQTAQGDDCPYSGRGPTTSLGACEQACNQDNHCNVINFSPTIPDCVFRACNNPLNPQLTADSRYSLYTNQRQLTSVETIEECEDAAGPETCGVSLPTRRCVWNVTATPRTARAAARAAEPGACVASGDDSYLQMRYLDARCRYQIRGFQMIRDIAILGYFGTSCPLEYAPPIPSM